MIDTHSIYSHKIYVYLIMSVLFLYAGSVNHWVCISDSKTINLLDSLNIKITRSLLLQIASVFKPDKAASKLYINRLCVHQQSGTLDCGLFAIALLLRYAEVAIQEK